MNYATKALSFISIVDRDVESKVKKYWAEQMKECISELNVP